MTQIKTMVEYLADGDSPDILFWVGSFDDRAKSI